MVINELKLSFLQTEALPEPLASLGSPSIPYQFLLSEPLYQAELARVESGESEHRMPWYRHAGKLFWFYYLEQTRIRNVKPRQAWRGLVPLYCDVDATVSAAWVPGAVSLRGYVYPWGIAVVADVQAKGAWSLDDAVEFGFQVRSKNSYDWKATGQSVSVPLNALLDRAIAMLRATAYGPTVQPGQPGEVFAVVSVLDAQDVNVDAPVESGKELHQALDAWSGWSQFWKQNQLKELTASIIEIKQSPAGHVLYGGRRGRVVWFPAAFESIAKRRGLECYHGNLLAATLQTESLCRLAQAVAKQLAAGQAIGEFSVTYSNCARLAAGILGRLYTGSRDTYRSNSVRDQIKRTYLDSVNTVRNPGSWSMPALS